MRTTLFLLMFLLLSVYAFACNPCPADTLFVYTPHVKSDDPAESGIRLPKGFWDEEVESRIGPNGECPPCPPDDTLVTCPHTGMPILVEKGDFDNIDKYATEEKIKKAIEKKEKRYGL